MTTGDRPAAPEDPAGQARGLSALCGSLREEYERTGHLADLDRAITAGRRCVELTAADGPLRARRLSNLAFALRLRFERLGAPNDILEAVRIGRVALGSNPDPADLPRLQSNLGVALRVLFEVSQARDHLADAATLARAALDGTPPGHPDHPGMLSNLGLALLELSEADHDQDGLVRAVAASAEALDEALDEDPDKPMYAANLSVALRLGATALNQPDDVDRAITVAEHALHLLPAEHPDRAGLLSDLGRAHRLRSTFTNDPVDARLAVELRRRAAAVRAAPAVTRALAARAWGTWAAEDRALDDAMDGFTSAVELLSQIAWHGLTSDARERHLSRWRELANDAAANALRARSADPALRMLEQGRTVLWNGYLDRSSDLGLLRDTSPALADRLLAIREVLNASAPRRRGRDGSDVPIKRRPSWTVTP